MRHARTATLVALLTLLSLAPCMAAVEAIDGMFYVPDIVGQFNSLGLRGDGLAFGVGRLPEILDMSICKHFQGVVRTQGHDGTPYLIVSRSGNDPGAFCITGDDPGNLFVVRMGSRDKDGERFRSNRLVKEWDPLLRDENGNAIPSPVGGFIRWEKPPDPRDRVEALLEFHGDLPYYGHPGGSQLVGDIMALGLENPYAGGSDALVLFFDVSNPETPELLSRFPVPGGKAGVVALTPVKNQFGPGLRYLMMTTGGDNDVLHFFRSISTNPDDTNGPTDLHSRDLDWELLTTVTAFDLEGLPFVDDTCFHDVDWPTGGPIRAAFGHQMFNFLHQGAIDGPIYGIGARNSGVGGAGADHIDLYEVNVDEFGNPLSSCIFTPVSTRHVSSRPFNSNEDSAALSAAAGTYVSPSGELIVYGTEYTNDGPFELKGDLANPVPGHPTVRFVEWRDINVVRPDSPTLSVTASVDGPFNVDEGSSVTITGAGKPPITKAWISLFEDDGAGSSLPGFLDSDTWLHVDYQDRFLDNFDQLDRFDDIVGSHYNENAGSWRWFAPNGCTMSANDYPSRSTEFPGPDTTQLVGNGDVQRVNDLNNLPVFKPSGTSILQSPVPEGHESEALNHDFDDDVAGVTFFSVNELGQRVHDCDGYYGAPVGFAWDLDRNGTFETSGNSVTFSAADLDGPSTVKVDARAQHFKDTSPRGTAFASGTVRVRNVPPAITQFAVFDSLGGQVGVDVPFVIQGTVITARGAFTDPGKPDHQTASLNWGDGTVEANAVFDQFSDAFGGVVGQLSRRHKPALPGNYAIGVTVTDDDGGLTEGSTTVSVLSPLQAVGTIISLLDQKIAGTTNATARTALLNARKALAGSVDGLGNNGALDKMEDDLIQAALVKLYQAIDYLKAAQAAGVNVGSLIALLQQVAAVLEAV